MYRDAGRLIRGKGDLNTFLSFDRLVRPGPPLPSFGHATGEFVDNDNLAISHDILPIEKHLAADLDRTLYVLVDRRQR